MRQTLQAEHRSPRRLLHAKTLRLRVDPGDGGGVEVSRRAVLKLRVRAAPKPYLLAPEFPNTKGEICMVSPDFNE